MPIIGKDADIIIMDDPHAVGDVVPRETVIGWFKGEVPEPIPTRNLPFGRDVDTLVLCKNDDHRDKIVKAIGIKAQYEVWTAALMGSRFKKVIWLGGWGDSASERAETGRMIRERLPTLLEPDGKVFIL